MEWAVGLAVLVYPHTWPSLGTTNSQFIRIEWKTGDELKIEIPASSFRNPRDLVTALNELLGKGRSDIGERIKFIQKKVGVAHAMAEKLAAHDVAALKYEEEEPSYPQNSTSSAFRPSDQQRPSSISMKAVKESLVKEHYSKVLLKELPEEADRLLLSRLKVLGGAYGNWIAAFSEIGGVCEILFNEQRQRFSVTFNKNYIKSIELSEQLSYIMGFYPYTVLEEKQQEARFVPDMTGGVSSFNIYAPGLLEPVIIGDITAPLLRMVNIKGQPDEMIEENYELLTG